MERHFHANTVFRTFIKQATCFIFAQGILIAHDGTVILWGNTRRLLAFAHFIQFFRSIKSIIGIAIVKQHCCMLTIDFCALRLTIRSEGTAFFRTFIKLYTRPTAGGNDFFFGTFHKTCTVCVFNAKNIHSAMMLGKKIIV